MVLAWTTGYESYKLKVYVKGITLLDVHFRRLILVFVLIMYFKRNQDWRPKDQMKDFFNWQGKKW